LVSAAFSPAFDPHHEVAPLHSFSLLNSIAAEMNVPRRQTYLIDSRDIQYNKLHTTGQEIKVNSLDSSMTS